MIHPPSVSGKQGALLPKVSTLMPTLTKAEHKVAAELLQNPQAVLYYSITEFAEHAGVHDTTVVRFCRKLGLKGYQEFKMLLAQEMAYQDMRNVSVVSGAVSPEDSVGDVKQKVLEMNRSALQETLALLDDASLEKAAAALQGARRVLFYGVGASGNTANDAKDKFMRIGFAAESYADSHLQAMSASLLTPEDVAIAISYSGSTMDTADTLAIAKSSGATTICITHYAKSPITHHADIVLLSGHNESPLQGGALSTKIAQLFVLDVLYAVIVKNDRQAVEANKARTAAAVASKLY